MQEITAPLATLPDDPVASRCRRRVPDRAARVRPARRRRLRAEDQPARRRAAGHPLARGGDPARARARRGGGLGDPPARPRDRRADHLPVAQRGRGPARGGAPGGGADRRRAPRSGSASSTPRPTGSGPSATGSSRTRASSRGSCSTLDRLGRRPLPASAETADASRPEPALTVGAVDDGSPEDDAGRAGPSRCRRMPDDELPPTRTRRSGRRADRGPPGRRAAPDAPTTTT